MRRHLSLWLCVVASLAIVAVVTSSDEEDDPYKDYTFVGVDRVRERFESMLGDSGFPSKAKKTCDVIVTKALGSWLEDMQHIIPDMDCHEKMDEARIDQIKEEMGIQDHEMEIDGKILVAKSVLTDEQRENFKRRIADGFEITAKRPFEQKSPWCNFYLMTMGKFLEQLKHRLQKVIKEIPINICKNQIGKIEEMIKEELESMGHELTERTVEDIFGRVSKKLETEKKYAEVDLKYLLNSFFPLPHETKWEEDGDSKDIVDAFYYNTVEFSKQVLKSYGYSTMKDDYVKNIDILKKAVGDLLQGSEISDFLTNCGIEEAGQRKYFSGDLGERFACQAAWNKLASVVEPLVKTIDTDTTEDTNMVIRTRPDVFKKMNPGKFNYRIVPAPQMNIREVQYDLESTMHLGSPTDIPDATTAKVNAFLESTINENLRDMPDRERHEVYRVSTNVVEKTFEARKSFHNSILLPRYFTSLESSIRKIAKGIELIDRTYKGILQSAQFSQVKGLMEGLLSFNLNGVLDGLVDAPSSLTSDRIMELLRDSDGALAAAKELETNSASETYNTFRQVMRSVIAASVRDARDAMENWRASYERFMEKYTDAVFTHAEMVLFNEDPQNRRSIKADVKAWFHDIFRE